MKPKNRLADSDSCTAFEAILQAGASDVTRAHNLAVTIVSWEEQRFAGALAALDIPRVQSAAAQRFTINHAWVKQPAAGHAARKGVLEPECV
jgi:hypothetical protein